MPETPWWLSARVYKHHWLFQLYVSWWLHTTRWWQNLRGYGKEPFKNKLIYIGHSFILSYAVDPDRECLDPSACQQFCVRNNFTGVETCSCESGFDLASDMTNCTSTILDINIEFNIVSFLHLLDVNECLGTNPCTQLCNDTVGSFMCRCNNGFQLESNGFTCTGICTCI